MPFGSFRLNTIGKSNVPGETYWFNIMSGDGITNRAQRCAVDSSGNIFVAANDNSERGLMMKFNSAGVIQWQKTAPANFVIRDVALDTSGNAYFCGGNEGVSPILPWLTKLDTTGSQLFSVQHTSDLAFTNEFYGIWIDSSNTINLVGRNNTSTAYWNTVYVRYNTTGSIVAGSPSQYVQGTTRYTQMYSISRATVSTNIFLVGQDNTGGNYYPVIVRITDAGGAIGYSAIFTSSLQSSGNNKFTGVISDLGSSTCFAVGGNHNGTNNCVYIVKLTTSTPTITWQRLITNIVGTATGVTQDTAGNIYLTSNGNNTGYISKFDTNGNHSWTRSISYATKSIVLNGIQWKNNSLYITGSTNVSTTEDPMLWKLPDSGSITGTYGGYVLASFTPTITTPTYTLSSPGFTRTARTNTASTVTAAPTTTTMTSTTTSL